MVAKSREKHSGQVGVRRCLKAVLVSNDRQEFRVVQPKISAWKLREGEAELFASAKDAPNWKLADKARRLLMDLDYRLSQLIPEPEAERATEFLR